MPINKSREELPWLYYPRSNSVRVINSHRFLDPAVAAFQAASGADDVSNLNDLVQYLRSQSLYANARIYPMTSTTNAGSGSTVYGIGGSTSNNMTLAGSPSWGADGITFTAASSQYGTIADFIGSETLNLFICTQINNLAGVGTKAIVTQWGGSSGQRSFLFGNNTDDNRISLFRTPDGSSGSQELYNGAVASLVGSQRTYAAQWVAGGTRALWQNNSTVSLSLATGSAQTSRFNSANDIAIAATFSGSSYGSFNNLANTACFAIVNTGLTLAQREAINDYVTAF